jgi:flavin reductase (DIM6/NTAB) family NADH-FMN oxidoreductase RutF
MSIDDKEFRRLLGRFAAGVTIITTTGRDGKPYGLTATAFSSVSLSPPLVLVCVDKRSESHPHLEASGVYGVNFLAEGQVELSNRFAKSGGEKFQGLALEPSVLGVPLLAGVLAQLECRVTTSVDAGDHTIFIGNVESGRADGGEPLLYFSGAYRSLAALA